MIELIPAIDIIEGKCVRLTKGDYSTKKVYGEQPLEVAKLFESHGLGRLHVVDLDGAKAGRVINYKVLEQLATKTSLTVDFGGGLKSDKDVEIAFECGAQMITGGSIAVKSPDVFHSWLQRYGAERIILGADVKDEKIAVAGWQEETTCELLPFIAAYKERGIKKTICTDISRDGMLQGAAVTLYKKILSEISGVYLIASGGVSSLDNIHALAEAGVPAVIFGKAVYEGRISLKDLEAFV